ncbi:CU044_5270 family protein [Lentzea sp. BCCO 10_0856]|uniref:CU044_5270 family protein n=1 Tax=Lentzea miocenica TaxID=3095431 RepID=A0ABU4SW26_9PSEU|nr:CU044_5270 family protein [Lentzea sp. BCCO 10_0856]MDX8030073.1 CU044_5270 family protein [Lentzea sp. BCCO 10_0856]
MSEPTKPETLDRVLDAALSRAGDEPVQFDVAAGKVALAAALKTRAEVAEPIAVGAEHRPRRRTRWLAAAAAVTVLAGAGLAASTVDLTGVGSNPASAAEELIKAADLASRVVDRPVGPGQYRYVRSHYTGITGEWGSDKAWTTDSATEEWIPADRRDEWMLRNRIYSVKWVDGHEGEGDPEAGTAFKDGEEFRAKCGMYSYFAEGYPDRCTVGSFHNPTPEFIASLPKDPAALLAKLREEGHAEDAGAFMSALEALRSGQFPAEVRANIFRALAQLPGLVVTDKRANLDGKEGVALGKRYYDDFTEIIIDPDNGDFIGTREVIAEDQSGDKGTLEKGTVRSSSAVTSVIVNSIGARP